MIGIKTNNSVLYPEIINFPDGTFKIDLPDIEKDSEVEIIWQYENESEVSVMLYIAFGIKENISSNLSLYMPYLPNARMDRTKNNKEVFTLKYFCCIINSVGFKRVKVLDVHSAVGAALIERCDNISPERYIRKAIEMSGIDPEKDFLFFPDEGSCKRYSSMFPDFGNIGFGIKKRNWKDGKILGLDLCIDSTEGRNVFIIDDICSYGGTVYHSAKALKEQNCGKIFSFFTHCENSISKGKLFEGELIEHIYTTNSICTLDTNDYPKLSITDCFD